MRYFEDQNGHKYNVPTNITAALGRKSDCDIPVPPLDEKDFDEIYFDVSRHHIRVYSEPEQCTIEDIRSTNGTKVDGEWVEPGTTHTLEDGNKVELGRVVLTYKEG